MTSISSVSLPPDVTILEIKIPKAFSFPLSIVSFLDLTLIAKGVQEKNAYSGT